MTKFMLISYKETKNSISEHKSNIHHKKTGTLLVQHFIEHNHSPTDFIFWAIYKSYYYNNRMLMQLQQQNASKKGSIVEFETQGSGFSWVKWKSGSLISGLR